jgi:hypothetical protein
MVGDIYVRCCLSYRTAFALHRFGLCRQTAVTSQGQTIQQPLTVLQDQAVGTQYTIYKQPSQIPGQDSQVICMRQPLQRRHQEASDQNPEWAVEGATTDAPKFQGYLFLGDQLAAAYVLSPAGAAKVEAILVDPFTNLPAGMIEYTGPLNQTIASFQDIRDGPQVQCLFRLHRMEL